MIEWRTLTDWSAEIGIPRKTLEDQAKREGWKRRVRAGRGGGFEYHYSSLPDKIRAAYILRHSVPKKPARGKGYDQDGLWARFERLTEPHHQEANRRLKVLEAVSGLMEAGLGKLAAIAHVAGEAEVNPATIRRWFTMVKGVERQDWLAALAPRYAGNTERTAQIDPRAWDWYAGHYLTRRKPTHADTYRRLEKIAAVEGWVIPSARTFVRRMETDVDRLTLTLMREGEEAMAALFPRQKRDATVFAAGEAVNGDGLKFDRLWVRFPDGEIINTATAWLYQDLRTRKILAWRLGKTENTDLFRLATYDLTGVCAPQFVWLDNTRVAANKTMTAGAPGRHRFKDKDFDGLGLLPALGMTPKWTNPDKVTGTPGAKPIERAFGIGGIHEKVATHPAFVDRGYSKATAIDAEELRAVLDQEIARHNSQKGRQTEACRGLLSFDEAWEEATRSIVFRKFSQRQRNMLLMVREVVRVDQTGMVSIKAGRSRFAKNRYWSEASARLSGKRVVAHFDPDDLHAGIFIYSLAGDYLCQAEHRPSDAFDNTTAGRELTKFRAQATKATKKAAAAVSRMSALERAALYEKAIKPTPDDPAPAVDHKVIAAHWTKPFDPQREAQRTGTDDAPFDLPEDRDDEFTERFSANVRALHERFRKEQL